MNIIPVAVWLTEDDVGTSGYFGLYVNNKYFVVELKKGKIILTDKVYNWKKHEISFNLALDVEKDVD